MKSRRITEKEEAITARVVAEPTPSRHDEPATTGRSRGSSRVARPRRGRAPDDKGSAVTKRPESAPAPTAGWYPDPLAGDGRRYWDGVTWTGHVMAPGASNPATGPSEHDLG